MIEHHIQRVADAGPALTYTGTTATVLFWGLHVSDIAVLLSTTASILGVTLQFYLALHRIRRLEHGQETAKKVIVAVAKGARVAAQKSADNTSRIAAVEEKVETAADGDEAP